MPSSVDTSSTLALPPEANAVITTTVKHTKKTTPHRTSASTTLAPMSPLVTSKQTYVITDPMTTKQRTLPLEENHSAASINGKINEAFDNPEGRAQSLIVHTAEPILIAEFSATKTDKTKYNGRHLWLSANVFD